MVLAVPEKRQFGKVVVACSMGAEIHREDVLCAMGTFFTFSQRPSQVRPFYLDLQSVVPMCQPSPIRREESFFEIDDCARQVL